MNIPCRNCLVFLFALAPALVHAQTGYVDYAEYERQHPLTKQERQSLTVEELSTWRQEEFDLLYARLKAGSIPDGEYEGNVIFSDSSDFVIPHVLCRHSVLINIAR